MLGVDTLSSSHFGTNPCHLCIEFLAMTFSLKRIRPIIIKYRSILFKNLAAVKMLWFLLELVAPFDIFCLLRCLQ